MKEICKVTLIIYNLCYESCIVPLILLPYVTKDKKSMMRLEKASSSSGCYTTIINLVRFIFETWYQDALEKICDLVTSNNIVNVRDQRELDKPVNCNALKLKAELELCYSMYLDTKSCQRQRYQKF